MERRLSPALPAALCLSLLLAGCGGSVSNLWPFGGEAQERSRTPADATEYQCAGGKRLYVRSLENGAAAWVILPERGFRLAREEGSASRYGNGSTVLDLGGSEATLSEGGTTTFAGCKAAAAPAGPSAR